MCVCASAWLLDLSVCLCLFGGLLIKMLCAVVLSSCTHAAVQSLACMSAHSVLFASNFFSCRRWSCGVSKTPVSLKSFLEKSAGFLSPRLCTIAGFGSTIVIHTAHCILCRPDSAQRGLWQVSRQLALPQVCIKLARFDPRIQMEKDC